MEARLSLRLDPNLATKSGDLYVDKDSDEALVRQVRSGDFSAYERLFERHKGLIYRFAIQMTGRRDDAEDLVQEVFVRAFQNLDKYRDEAKFTTWLVRIATNLGTDRARTNQRRQTLEAQEASGGLLWMTVGDQENPIDNLEGTRRADALRAAIEALPDHHRRMIVMRDIEEMEYKDIASVLRCTVGGAKLRVLRARRALRSQLEPLIGEEAAR